MLVDALHRIEIIVTERCLDSKATPRSLTIAFARPLLRPAGGFEGPHGPLPPADRPRRSFRASQSHIEHGPIESFVQQPLSSIDPGAIRARPATHPPHVRGCATEPRGERGPFDPFSEREP